MANCHHRDLNAANYTDISNEEHFVMLNNYSHKAVHYLFNIAKNRGLEPLLDDIREQLTIMMEINDVEGK